MSGFYLVFALVWGLLWAACLQFTRWGRWLALYRTWITVVVGVGVDLIILFFVLPRRAWLSVLQTLACSAVGIIARSLWNEYGADAEL